MPTLAFESEPILSLASLVSWITISVPSPGLEGLRHLKFLFLNSQMPCPSLTLKV